MNPNLVSLRTSAFTVFVPVGSRLWGVRYELGSLVVFDANSWLHNPATHRFAFSDDDRAWAARSVELHARREFGATNVVCVLICNHVDDDGARSGARTNRVHVLLASPPSEPFIDIVVPRAYFSA